MSPRRTGLLLVAALALGALVYLLEFRGADPDRSDAASQDALFPDLESGDVEWLELTTSDARRVRAVRDDGPWRLVAPGLWPADAVALDGLAGQLADLEVAGRTAAGGSPEAFGVGDDVPPIRFEADGAVRALRIGKRTPVGSNTYVRVDDADEVAWVETWRTNALRKSLADLRDRRMLAFDHAAVQGLEVRWPTGQVAATRRDGDWVLTRPVQERADRSTIETLLSDLAFLRADGFVEEELSPEASGLDQPVLSITLIDAGEGGSADPDAAASRTLVFGALRDDQRIARGAEDTLFLVDAGRLDDFPQEVLAYRDKTLGDFDVAAARGLVLELTEPGADASTAEGPVVRRLEATLAAGRWQTAPETVADARVRGMVRALSQLQAAAIVAESVGPDESAALGLSPGRVRARVTDEAGATLAEVVFGLHEPGRGLLARRPDAPTIYRVDDTATEWLPTSATDLEARFLGAETPPDEPDAPLAPDDDDLLP